MAKAYPTRTKTYGPSVQVASADLNAIQDGIIATSDAVGDLAHLDEPNVIDELKARSGKLRIAPWAVGERPQVGASTITLKAYNTPPWNVQLSAVGTKVFYIALDPHFAGLVISALKRLRVRFSRSAAASALVVKLYKETIIGSTQVALQTLTVTSTAGTFTTEQTGEFTESYNPDTNNFYLEVTITCDVATDEVKLRHIEVEWEGKHIGSY